MARIYLDARNITEQPSGVARYAQALIPELVRQAPEHEFITIRHSSNRRPLEVIGCELEEVFVDRHIDNLDNFVFGARTLRRVFRAHGPPDIYHDLFHVLPVGLKTVAAEQARVVVTLHDLVWIDYPHQSQPDWLTAEAIRLFGLVAIPLSLRAADHVICVSEPTARRARPWLTRGEFTTIYHGVEAAFFGDVSPPTDVLSALIDGQIPYVVAIGNDKEYKNLHRLIDAFARIYESSGPAHLVLIGSCESLRPRIQRAGLDNHVTLTGFLDDDQLRSVLGHARLFVFPSLVEGFGLPILEAMAMGVPTAVSDLEPMRTIAGSAALKVDPYAPEAIAEAIERVLGDDALYERLRERGQRRAAEFRWPITARKTLRVYRELLE